ncbi:MAG TPA: hypothetical protein VIF62_20240 [Labilithrix sp.]
MRKGASAIVLLAALGFAAPARAQSNEAGAEALFNEGVALVESGHVEEGCKKLEASEALDPATGTLIHLGDCYEKVGRAASAWARFREAASRASKDGRTDWETVAKTRASEIEPKLAHLRIDATAGITVRRDGQDVPAAAFGSALPIDPGDYTIAASANGKKTWSAKVHVESASLTTVSVPALEDEPASSSPASPSAEPDATLRTVGWGIAAVGVAGVIVGGVSGLVAIGHNNASKRSCPNDGPCADDSARSDNASARTAATISTVGFVAGGVLLAGGIALVLVSPSPRTAIRATPRALFFEGVF